MEQKSFSKLVKEFLEKSFPEFTSTLKYQEDESFDCFSKSPSGKFSMWIATYYGEITFGLEAPNGETDIHTHISCYEIEDLENCLATLTKLINEIKENKVILYLNSREVYDWIDYNDILKKESKKGKIYPKYFWNEN